MLARTLLVAASLSLAVVLNAYAPTRDAGAGNRDGRAANRDRNGAGAAREQQTNFANARVTTNATLFHAPNQAIGMLRAGASVRVDRFDRNWAHVTFTNNQIAVQGWVQTRALAPLTGANGDRVKTQEDRERKRNEDRARKQELRRNDAGSR